MMAYSSVSCAPGYLSHDDGAGAAWSVERHCRLVLSDWQPLALALVGPSLSSELHLWPCCTE